MEIWAHRGLVMQSYENGRWHPGNTIFDFKGAYDCGVHGIETDVAMNTEGEVLIYHPGTLTPDPLSLSWPEASKIHPGLIRIESLIEFLKTRPDLQCCLDLKQNSQRLANKVAERVILSKLEDRVFLNAFQKRVPFLGLETDGELLTNVKKRYPSIQTHLMVSFPFNLPSLAEKYEPDMISFGWLDDSIISKLFFNLLVRPAVNLSKDIEILHEMGIKVMAGISSNPNTMLYFERLRVDAFMTENAIMAFSLDIATERN